MVRWLSLGQDVDSFLFTNCRATTENSKVGVGDPDIEEDADFPDFQTLIKENIRENAQKSQLGSFDDDDYDDDEGSSFTNSRATKKTELILRDSDEEDISFQTQIEYDIQENTQNSQLPRLAQAERSLSTNSKATEDSDVALGDSNNKENIFENKFFRAQKLRYYIQENTPGSRLPSPARAEDPWSTDDWAARKER